MPRNLAALMHELVPRKWPSFGAHFLSTCLMSPIGTTQTFLHVRGEVRFGTLNGRVADVGQRAAHDPWATFLAW
jgi:hypothetical protein